MASIQSNRAPAQINRRRLLSAIPAVAVLPAVAATPALAETETPMETLFRQWLVFDEEERRAWNEGWPEEEQDAATDRKLAVERQMRAAPKHDLTDVALALFATSDCGAFNIDTDVRLEYRAQARALMAA